MHPTVQLQQEVATDVQAPPLLHGPQARHHVDLSDEPTSNLLQHLPVCVDFIGKNLDDGRKVLVHCAAGVSRSTTVRRTATAPPGLGSPQVHMRAA